MVRAGGAAVPVGTVVGPLDLAHCHFVGHSMGGFVALRLAARRPDLLRSAVAISSSADDEGAHAKTADAIVHLVFGNTTIAERPQLWDRWRRHFTSLDPSIIDAAEGGARRTGVLKELVGVTVPLLVLSGAEDEDHAELSQRIADTAANATHTTVAGAGHSLAVEQPGVVNDHLAAHLEAI